MKDKVILTSKGSGEETRLTGDKFCRICRASDNFAIFVIFGAYYFSVLQVTVLAPILPGILEEINNNKGYRFGMRNESLKLTDDLVVVDHRKWWAGAILTSGGLAEMLMIPVAVKFTRVCGYKYALYLSSLLEVCGCTVLAFSKNLPMLFVGRIIQCWGVALLDISGNAMLASRFDEITRPRAFATAFNGIPLGYVTSALAGTIAYEYFGYTITLLAIGVFGCLEALLRFVMIERRTVREDTEDYPSEFEAYTVLFTESVPVICSYLAFLMCATLYLMYSTVPADIIDHRGGHFWQIGVIIAISTFVEIIAQHIVGILGPKYGFGKFMFIGLLSISSGLVVYAWLSTVWLTSVTFILQKIGYGFIWPAVGCLLSDYVENSGLTTYEHVFGFQYITKVFGISVGAFTGVVLTDECGINVTYWAVAALCFISAFTICFIKTGKSIGIQKKTTNYTS